MPSLKPCMTASRCAAARSTRACHSAALHSPSVCGETLNCIGLLPDLHYERTIAPTCSIVMARLDPAIHRNRKPVLQIGIVASRALHCRPCESRDTYRGMHLYGDMAGSRL